MDLQSNDDHRKKEKEKEKEKRHEPDEKGSILGSIAFDLNGYAQKTSNTITELFGRFPILILCLSFMLFAL